MARLKEVVDDFKELLPLVQELGNPALQPRHWQDIFDIIGADIPTNESGIGACWLCWSCACDSHRLAPTPRVNLMSATLVA